MKVREFLKINDPQEIEKVKSIKKGLEGRNYIEGHKSRPFIDYSFSKVEELKEWYAEGNILYLVSSTCGIGHKELLDKDYKDLVYYLKFIDDQIAQIMALERNLNEKDDDELDEAGKMELCGINELDKFGSLNIIDSLSGGDLCKWEIIERKPWKVVYTALLKNKTNARIQRRYHKLKEVKK